MAAGSVLKGSGALAIARVGGMVGSFVLFLLLTWRSKEAAGAFRTAATYLVIMDTLPLLGMHRWLATETARHREQGWALFRMACMFACGIAALSALAFLAIAASGSYSAEISASLELVAAATIPSALNLCVLCSLVGIGRSDQSGALGVAEAAVRSVVAVVLVMAGAKIVYVVLVFVVARWLVALGGFAMVRHHLAPERTRIDPALAREFFTQIPTLGLAMLGFLAIRSTAMLLLPIFSSDAEAGRYAAPFQLFDLLLMAPTVLIVGANYAFVASAGHSMSALRRSTSQLLTVTGLYAFPLVAIACVLAGPMLVFVFGPAYADAATPFRLLLLCAAVLAIDQVLALSMVTVGDYRTDRTCILTGGVVVVVATCVLSGLHGANGAALACLIGVCAALALRLSLLRRELRRFSTFASLRPPAIAALVAAAGVWLVLMSSGLRPGLAELALGPAGLAVYLARLYLGGGVTRRRRSRVLHFMTRPG